MPNYHLYLPGQPVIAIDTTLANGKTLTIGSAPDCDLCVNEKFVNHKHCQLVIHNNQIYLQPELARATLINGEIVEKEYQFKTGFHRINIGGACLSLDVFSPARNRWLSTRPWMVFGCIAVLAVALVGLQIYWYCNYTNHLEGSKKALIGFEAALLTRTQALSQLKFHLPKAADCKNLLLIQPKSQTFDDVVTRSIWMRAYQESDTTSMNNAYVEQREYLSSAHPMRRFSTFTSFDRLLNKEVALAWNERSNHASKHLAYLMDLRTKVAYPALDSAVLILQKSASQNAISAQAWEVLNRNGVSSIPKKFIADSAE